MTTRSASTPVTSQRHPWEGRPLLPSEIEFEEKAHRALLESVPKHRLIKRLSWWILNRAYISALKEGETMEDANTEAASSFSRIFGFVFGVIFTLLALTTLSWIVGVFRTMETVSAFVVLIVWVLILAVSIEKTRTWLKAKFAKRKKKPKEAQS